MQLSKFIESVIDKQSEIRKQFINFFRQANLKWCVVSTRLLSFVVELLQKPKGRMPSQAPVSAEVALVRMQTIPMIAADVHEWVHDHPEEEIIPITEGNDFFSESRKKGRPPVEL